MYSFNNDYSEGAHPNILRALETINYHQNNSYGLDEHSGAARELFLGEPSGIRARFLFRRPHLFLFMA